jgi:hypothetical protein
MKSKICCLSIANNLALLAGIVTAVLLALSAASSAQDVESRPAGPQQLTAGAGDRRQQLDVDDQQQLSPEARQFFYVRRQLPTRRRRPSYLNFHLRDLISQYRGPHQQYIR